MANMHSVFVSELTDMDVKHVACTENTFCIVELKKKIKKTFLPLIALGQVFNRTLRPVSASVPTIYGECNGFRQLIVFQEVSGFV
jgi:hypothetical protein